MVSEGLFRCVIPILYLSCYDVCVVHIVHGVLSDRQHSAMLVLVIIYNVEVIENKS